MTSDASGLVEQGNASSRGVRHRYFGVLAGVSLGSVIGAVSAFGSRLAPTQLLALALLVFGGASLPIVLSDLSYWVFALILVSPIEALYWRAFDAQIKIYYLVTIFAITAYLLQGAVRGRIGYTRNVLFIPICLFYAVRVVTLAYSPFKVDTSQYLILFALLLGIFFAVTALITDRMRYRRCTLLILLVGTLVCGLGVIQLAAYRLLGLTIAVILPRQYQTLVSLSRASSTFHEPDNFAAYAAYVFMLLLSYWLSRAFRRYRPLLGVGLVLSILALLFAQARAAMVGVACGSVLLLGLLYWGQGRVQLRRLAAVVALAVTLALVLALTSPQTFSTLTYRVRRLFSAEAINPETGLVSAGTSSARVNTILRALEMTVRTPQTSLVGVGFGTWEQYATAIRAEGGAGSNVLPSRSPASILVAAYYDAGVPGLFTLLLIPLAYASGHLRALRYATDEFWRGSLIASLCSFSALFVSFVFTDYSYLGFVWIQLGLAAVAINLATKSGTKVQHEA
jgi:hypothetical protein